MVRRCSPSSDWLICKRGKQPRQRVSRGWPPRGPHPQPARCSTTGPRHPRDPDRRLPQVSGACPGSAAEKTDPAPRETRTDPIQGQDEERTTEGGQGRGDSSGVGGGGRPENEPRCGPGGGKWEGGHGDNGGSCHLKRRHSKPTRRQPSSCCVGLHSGAL